MPALKATLGVDVVVVRYMLIQCFHLYFWECDAVFNPVVQSLLESVYRCDDKTTLRYVCIRNSEVMVSRGPGVVPRAASRIRPGGSQLWGGERDAIRRGIEKTSGSHNYSHACQRGFRSWEWVLGFERRCEGLAKNFSACARCEGQGRSSCIVFDHEQAQPWLPGTVQAPTW